MLGTGSEDEEELCEALKTCQNIEQIAGFIIQRCHRKSAKTSGPAVSSRLMRGENESSIEKTHLITARVCRNIANDKQIKFLDMGTDFCYPFYDVYPPTQAALRALGDNAMEILHYPSSFGLESLRQAFQSFMRSTFGADLDWKRDIMINTGASQAFDALSRALEGRYVVLPHLSLPTVGVIATANGAELLRIPSNAQNGMMDLHLAQAEIDRLPPGSVRFLYLNSPLNPTGHVASLDYLQEIVNLLARTVFSLFMIWTRGTLITRDLADSTTFWRFPGLLTAASQSC
ncbi:pyridoxal phosphate-dependent transferase [Trichoderma barbatum]